jgi:hypothetical protein
MTRPNEVEWNAIMCDSRFPHPYFPYLYQCKGALPVGLMAVPVA